MITVSSIIDKIHPYRPSTSREEIVILTTRRYTLKEARNVLGMSREDLSRASGVSISTIARIENGDQPWSTNIETAMRLASALALTPDEIVWPHGLSFLGRRPLSGVPLTKKKEEPAGLGQCPDCYLLLPYTGICGNCT